MRQKWWILAAVACGTFMATLDSSIVNIALPTLTKTFSTDLDTVKWVVVLYLLVITCLLLPFGRVSDLFGRKKMFLAGYTLFTLGSALCGTVDSIYYLFGARIVQAIGAAMLMSNGPALITSAFPASERGVALGTMGMVVSVGLVTGPSLGGFLISTLGWSWIFFVNIPFGLLGFYLIFKFVEKDKVLKTKGSFDWAGSVTQVLFLLSFIFVFDRTQSLFTYEKLGLFTLSLVLLISFIAIEKKSSAPVFDLSLLKNRTFWSANLASFFIFVSFSSISVLFPFFLEEVLFLSPDQAGLFMSAIPLTIFIMAPLSGWVSDRFGSRELSVLGSLSLCFCLLLMAGVFGPGLDESISKSRIIAILLLAGGAIGLFQSPNNSAIMGSVPVHKLGSASALLATIRNLGLFVGTGLSTGIFSTMLFQGKTFLEALQVTHIVASATAFLAMMASFAKKRTS